MQRVTIHRRLLALARDPEIPSVCRWALLGGLAIPGPVDEIVIYPAVVAFVLVPASACAGPPRVRRPPGDRGCWRGARGRDGGRARGAPCRAGGGTVSAWVVEREHVDLIVRYALDAKSFYWDDDDGSMRRLQRSGDADAVGRMLAHENVASVCFRYEQDSADEYGEMVDYRYREPGYTLTHGEALKAIGCLEYQSCEHPGWKGSEACRFLAALEEHAKGELYAGPWGWDADALAEARARVAGEVRS